jgi:DNA polymerase elongation subunit (family B)
MQNSPAMFTGVYHDTYKDMVFVWHGKGSTPVVKKVKHQFYTPNRGEMGAIPSGKKDIYGNDMYIVPGVDHKQEMDIKSRFSGPHNYLSEIDIDYRTRFLEDYYKGVDEIRFDIDDFNVGFIDIEVESGKRFPTPKRAAERVNCVTLYLSAEKKYYVYGLEKDLKPETYAKLRTINAEYIKCPTEGHLLTWLFSKIGTSNVDILTGWNSSGYDQPFLMKRAEIIGVDPKLMSRLPKAHQKCYEDKRTRNLVIGGTECLDYLKLFKQFSRGERDDYKLDTIGKEIVGEQKAPLPDGYQSYKNYWDDYVWYNIKDVELVVQIDKDQRLIETVIGACSEARVPFSHIFESKKILVGFLLNFLHKRGLVMPPLKENESKKFPGAYVYSTPGYYEELVSYDYRSMYPSIMMGANISPETKVTFDIDHVFTPEEEEYVKTLVKSPWDAWGTKKIYYRKDIEGIVPQVVKILFDGRTELKKEMKSLLKLGKTKEAEYYDMKQQAYKIFGNSLYGLLGNSFFQLYDLDNSASVTAYGVDLITSTIEDLVHYFENDFENDERYFNVFGEKPTLDRNLFGSYINESGQTVYNRISHGDTDSFFVKYSDIYPPYGKHHGKDVEVYVFKDNELVSKQRFDLDTREHDSKVHFNRMCNEFISDWSETDNERKKKMFIEGIVFGDNGYRVIYSRFTLTDYSRVIDAALMEDKLDEIMQVYQNKWNYLHDTIFLKREKCIKKAIVQAKKKYICKTESNEDIRYYKKGSDEPILKYAVTGLEIVRSSTTPFARERIQYLIDIMLDDLDKKRSRDELLKIKEEFFEITRSDNPYDICIPSGVGSDPPEYSYWMSLTDEQRKAVKLDWRVKSAMVWNHLIETDPILSEMTLEPIAESSKAKFIKVATNSYGISKLAFVGKEPPKRLLELFHIDWDNQWKTTYGDTMGRLFEAVGWSANLEADERDVMMELY